MPPEAEAEGDESSSSEGEDAPEALLCDTIEDEPDTPETKGPLVRGMTMHESITILTKVKGFATKMIKLRDNNRKKYKIVEEIVSV